MPGCNGNDGRSRFLRLRYNAKLRFCAPAVPTLSRTEDIDLAVRHDFKVDLKVILGAMTAHRQAVAAGCLPPFGSRIAASSNEFSTAPAKEKWREL
jgi:hypothetical protein